MMIASAPGTGESLIPDSTCTACGCLCDDIVVAVQGDRIAAARNACPLGERWFFADHRQDGKPPATIEGNAVSRDDALDRVAATLLAAKTPLILGLVSASLEAQAKAVAIADRIGATIDPASSRETLARWRAIQRVGIVSATLGEVKARADLVVFWGVDPVTTHPRHLERYSVEPRGRFVPEGRTVVVVDAEKTATASRADLFVAIPRDRRREALETLRALTAGIDDIEASDDLRELARRMKTARYGALFFGPTPDDPALVESLLKLVRDRNENDARFVGLPLGGAKNGAGAEAALTWQGGSPVAVDFGLGYPRFLPDEATAELRLARGECDVALVVGDDPRGFLSEQAHAALARLRVIRVGPHATDDPSVLVAINTATPGIDAGGTFLRSDGASLPLRPSLSTTLPTDSGLLAAIERRLAEASP